MKERSDIPALAKCALDGDRAALDDLVRAIQPDVYGVAVRMLWNREDAEDATQEIVIRVVTRLSQFDFRSSLRTWVYRIAVNFILDVKKSPVERMRLTFERFADDLADGLSAGPSQDAERSVLVEEVKIGCTLAMLQCLDRHHRIAYVVGEILEMTGPEATAVLNVPAAVFRKRLQRARQAVSAFTRSYCGLVSDAAACRCHRRVDAAVRAGRVNPARPDFADKGTSFDEAQAMVRRVEEARWALEVHRTNEPSTSAIDLSSRLIAALEPDVSVHSRRDAPRARKNPPAS